jgi:adenosyl cobinamide kinase/adenosyl cobinamide phosphate guanylyltransferase
VITLVLGGRRSGKSAVAEACAAALPPPVTYVATGAATDDDMAARIEAHRRRRPAAWSTVEVGTELAEALRSHRGTVLVDGLGTWVAGHEDLVVDIDELVDALQQREGATVLVSDEVGLAVHPVSEVGQRFVDVLGDVNQAVAAIAGDVLLVVAGRPLRLPAPA